MADRHWVGATSGDFATAGNWLEGAVPVNGDNLIFRYGNRDLDINVDQSAKTFGSVTVLPGYTGRLGVSLSTPFKCACSTFNIKGGADKGIFAEPSGSPTIFFYGAGPNGTAPVYLKGTIPTIVAYLGNLYLESGTITRLLAQEVGKGGLIITANTPTITTLQLNGGYLTQNSTGTITTANVNGGRLRVDSGTVTTLNLSAVQSTVWWNSATAAITTLRIERGTFDCSESSAARTITNSELHEGGRFIDPYTAVTLTNAMKVYGGEIVRTLASSDALYP